MTGMFSLKYDICNKISATYLALNRAVRSVGSSASPSAICLHEATLEPLNGFS
jgi:hypothetical protein